MLPPMSRKVLIGSKTIMRSFLWPAWTELTCDKDQEANVSFPVTVLMLETEL